MYGGIEAGGTKFVCAVADQSRAIIEKIKIDTTTPEETMRQVIDFFKQYHIKSLGVGSFGPIDINEKSDTFGYILTTPKSGWSQFDFLGYLKEYFDISMYWTTDVHAAAYGEYMNATDNIKSCLYLTVGTGVGGGLVMDGEIVNGFNHPEMGHIIVKRHDEDNFEGSCPYHGDCLEGLASGSSLEKRLGRKGNTLETEDEVWDLVAYYIAQALVNYTLVVSPERIILGGGVMNQEHLIQKIRNQFIELNKLYVTHPAVDNYIQIPSLGSNAGIVGALSLAEKVLLENKI